MPSLSVLNHLRLQDVVDIVFLTFLTYHLYVWFSQTRAFKALVGLLGLGIIYSVAQFWGLFLTTWVFQILWQVLIILLIILFQNEIRQVLEKVNPFQALGWKKSAGRMPWMEGFARAIFTMAATRLGALVLFERNDRLREFLTGGVPLEAEPTGEILTSIFQKHSPLHDGAVVIQNGRIILTAAFLPLTSREGISQDWGTRHRAAIGITERCDAWAVIVSEERGQVSLARGGVIEPIATPEALTERLKTLPTPDRPDTESGFQKVKRHLMNRWRLKLATLAIVSVVWFSFAGQQNVEVTLEVPLATRNLASGLEADPAIRDVGITARGQRRDIGVLNSRNVKIDIDLADAGIGTRTYRLGREDVSLPNDRVDIVEIEPRSFTVEIRPVPEAPPVQERP